MSEAELRAQIGLPMNQEVTYRAATGAVIGYAQFAKQVRGGSTFEMKKAQTTPYRYA